MVNLMKLIASHDEELNRIQMEFLNDKRVCEFLQDTPELTVNGQTIGPFKKGNRIKLPNWIIDVLKSQKIVRLIPAENYDSSRVLENLYREEQKKKHGSLQSLPPFLYASANRRIFLLQCDKTSLDPVSIDEIERLQTRLNSLIETRQLKIIRAATSNSCSKWHTHLTREERLLCNQIWSIITSWKKLAIKWNI